MISVPNHRLPLNGNNVLLLFLTLVLFGSCDLFRKLPDDGRVYDDDDIDVIQGPVTVDPETGDYQDVTTLVEKMDTIRWVELSPERFPPITSLTPFQDPNNENPDLIVDPKAEYRMALLLPFMTNRYSAENPEFYSTSEWAMHYYGGFQLGMEDLASEEISLIVDVIDTKASEQEINQLIQYNNKLRKADVILGPYRSVNVRAVSDFAKQNGKIIISPYSAAGGLSREYPDFIQVNPSLESHCESIMEHALRSHTADQIVLVVRDKPDETTRLEIFQTAHNVLGDPQDTSSLREYLVPNDPTKFNEMDLTPLLDPEQETVFIVPSWSNETFIHSFLRQLKIAATDMGGVVVYGMPKWKEYDRVIDYDLYEDLNVHISSSFYVDKYAPEVQDLTQRFFDRFGTIPEEEAFIGYESGKYFVRMLKKYGKDFPRYLEENDRELLYSQFQFRRAWDDGDPVPGDYNRKPDRYENTFVHILKFRDYFFQPADD
jgi:hypothetical protein